MGALYLAPMFAYPLHPSSWSRPAGSIDYRVTNTFYGTDLINGGGHNATDLGNYRTGDPLAAPADCRARALYHWDGARGVEFDLGGGVTIRLWHLETVSLPESWADVRAGERVGYTGASGAPVNGQPMAAHTHAEADRNGVPFDIEPALFGAPIEVAGYTPEDDDAMRVPDGLAAVVKGYLPEGANLYAAPGDERPLVTLDDAFTCQVFGRVHGPPWEMASAGRSGDTWYYIGAKGQAGYVPTGRLPELHLTDLGCDYVAESACPPELP